MTKRRLAAVAVAACLAALGGAGYWATHRKPTGADLRDHIVRKRAFWRAYAAKPLAGRIFAAPPELADYLRIDNELNGFPSVPHHEPVPEGLGGDARAVLGALPPQMQALLQDKLLGVFFVTGLGSTAYTEFVRDDDGRPSAAFIALDTDALARRANAWLSWKESSPFMPDARVRIEGTLETPEHDDRRGALEFVLIHELGHALAFDSAVHPLWTMNAAGVELDDYPFASMSWVVKDGRYAFKAAAPAPGPIIYYRPGLGKPAATDAARYYDWLAGTDFPTLYAATNLYDDFADSLATYVHSEVYGKPFELRIVQDGTVVRTLHACWKEPRCAAKRAVLEAALGFGAPSKAR